MLLLTRRPGEVITIGDGIEITIMEVSGRQVRVGVLAPKDVKIMRKELLGRPPKEKRP